MDSVNVNKVENTVVSFLPDEGVREICLVALLESINQANAYGGDKWGVYYQKDRVRLLVGNLIVFTIHKGRIWLALDQPLLSTSKDKQILLESSDSWQWDTDDYPEYVQVPSRNGYYTPSEDYSEIWPVIRELHFEFIKNATKKYRRLNKKSRSKHTPELLDYLRRELGQYVPEPDYENAESQSDFRLPEEILDDVGLYEGSKQRVSVNAYERNPKARQDCIAYYGTSCSVCKFNFGEMYGDIGEGFIHVHHLKPLADIGDEYEVNPINDLRPVCPNCHAIIHRRNPPYTIEEVQRFLRSSVLK